MPPPTEEIHRRLTTEQQFLFSKPTPEAPAQKPETDINDLISVEKLKEKFPEILAEDRLQEEALARLADVKTFGAMVVRLDDVAYIINPNDIMATLAGVIDTVCQSAPGIWGLVNPFTVGCFFPETDEAKCLDLSRKIKDLLSKTGGETVSTGIAVYPTLSFAKADILNNAQKALDHAAFFGANSCVAFDSVSLNISGDKFYQAGDLEGAMREYYLALTLDENNVNVHNSLGVCHGIRQDLEKALDEFKTAIRLSPEEKMAIYNAGYVHFLKKEYADALAYFQKAEQIDDTVFELAIQTGRIHLELNQAETAKKYLEKATILNPNSAAAFRLLGDAYASLDLITDAITAYKTTLKRNPEDAEALSALGYFYELQGKNADIALMLCLQGIELSPDNGLFRHRIGRLYLNRNQVEKALDEFQKAQELGYKSDEYISRTLKLLSGS